MIPTAFQWLPVGIGVTVSLLGLLGLAAALLPTWRTKYKALVADSTFYLVTGALLLGVFTVTGGRVAPGQPLVETGLTSDPTGAAVYLDDVFAGYTPLAFRRPKGTRVRYRIQVDKAVTDMFVYESYKGEVTVDEAVIISVWLNREPLEP